MTTTLQYLNTDLELGADFDLCGLVAELRQSGLFVLNDETLARGFAVLELNAETAAAADTIELMIAAIEALPVALKSDWARCASRVFDIGFASGAAPRSIATALPAALLRRISDVGASVGITIYALEADAVAIATEHV